MMAAFAEPDWTRFDVWAVVAMEGGAVVEGLVMFVAGGVLMITRWFGAAA